MFERIETLRMADALIAHGAKRQQLIATNVANSDTPDYRARDLADFSSAYDTAPPIGMRMTNARHVSGSDWGMGASRSTDTNGEPAPNGNTVSLEEEVFRLADARRQFDLALTVTKSSLGLIRTSIGRRA